MLDFPRITDETIEIQNVFVIRNASFKVSQITCLIGPQASGKSIAAKCLFFFRNYISDLFVLGTDSSFSRPSFNKGKIEELEGLFPNLVRPDSRFSIVWKSGGLSISVSKDGKGTSGKIRLSDPLSSLFRRFRNDYLRFSQKEQPIDNDEHLTFRHGSLWEYRESSEDRSKFLDSIPGVLFVPASRAFFSVIQSEVFTLLSAQQSLDKIMIQFGRFYSNFRMRYDRDRYRNSHRLLEEQGRMGEVIGGKFRKIGKKDIILTDWGEVPLPSSSSGQQEALPLMLALRHYPFRRKVNDLIIVEEPEAHLFPDAQKTVLEEMVETSKKERCKIVFTTHSPYILSCLNTEIARNNWNSEIVSSFYIASGRIRSIFDKEYSMVDINAVDSVSQKIAEEFLAAVSRNG